MPLPTGTWNLNANGNGSQLIIGSTATGTINGSAGGQPITGFFDEATQMFSFMRVTSSDVSKFEIYSGLLFSFSPNPSTQVNTLGGTFRGYPAEDGNALPWSAQLAVKLKEKEGKDGKDKEATKDNKEAKDRKDTKEGGKDHEKHPKDKELESVHPSSSPQDPQLEQLAMRLNALEQQVAVGHAFIQPEERPSIGAQTEDTNKR